MISTSARTGDYTLVMGANTYKLMHGFASAPQDDFGKDEKESIAGLAKTPKVVFSSKLEGPLPWENTELVSGDVATKVSSVNRSRIVMPIRNAILIAIRATMQGRRDVTTRPPVRALFERPFFARKRRCRKPKRLPGSNATPCFTH